MSNIISKHLHTWLNFEHVQKNNFVSAYNTTYTDVCQRIYKRLPCMPNVPLTYISVCERMSITLAYAVVRLHLRCCLIPFSSIFHGFMEICQISTRRNIKMCIKYRYMCLYKNQVHVFPCKTLKFEILKLINLIETYMHALHVQIISLSKCCIQSGPNLQFTN